MKHDADEFHGVEAIGGLLSGLCYLWRQGLVLPCGTEREWIADLMRSVAGIDAARWGDKSRKVMLPALQVLIEMGAITLGAAQPALAVLLRGPAGASSGYTAADLAQAIKGLGVAEETVLALPPDAIALPAECAGAGACSAAGGSSAGDSGPDEAGGGGTGGIAADGFHNTGACAAARA